jgi:hypothetical protein
VAATLAAGVALYAAPLCAEPSQVIAEPWWASPDPEHPYAEHTSSWSIPTVHAFGVMTGMRISAAMLWPEPFAETDPLSYAESYGRAVSDPPVWDSTRGAFEWDGNDWPLNVLGHGAFGSELYLRARTCRRTMGQAVFFAAAQSAVWEYVFEGNAVQPSALDLVYTPLAGMVLGEARFALWYAARGMRHRAWGRVLATLIDPFGEVERAVGSDC